MFYLAHRVLLRITVSFQVLPDLPVVTPVKLDEMSLTVPGKLGWLFQQSSVCSSTHYSILGSRVGDTNVVSRSMGKYRLMSDTNSFPYLRRMFNVIQCSFTPFSPYKGLVQ